MYNQLIYFVVVLLLFSFQPPAKASAPSYTNAWYILVMFLAFAAYCRASFRKLQQQASRGLFLSAVTRGYHRIQTRLFIMAIAWLFLYIYLLNIKLYLRLIPGFDQSSTISGLTGLAIYTIHLCVIWYYSLDAYKIVYASRLSRPGFIKAQASFAVVLLVPWLLISGFTDLLQLVKMPAFISSDTAQILVVALALVGFVLFGPWLMVRLWRCEPLPSDSVKEELEKYCERHGFRLGGFFLWPLFGGEMLTAGIVGILPGLRYILITSGLLRILDTSELKAVVAHEMGHVRKKHLLFFVGLFTLFILLVYNFTDMIVLMALSNRTILRWALMPDEGAYLVSLLSSVPLVILMVLFFRFIFGFFLRNSERQADLFALQLLGTPLPLVSSFEKIAHHSGQVIDLPNWHHFSLQQRIDFIVAASENPALTRRHNRKLYGAAAAFVLAFCVLFTAGMGANNSSVAGNWRSEIQLGMLEREISQRPGDAELQGAYGGLLYERGRYSEAESVLNAALGIDPNNAAILNNLAWLYATTPDPYRNPSEALELAIRAVEIKPAPHILDTLAEAYYVNGRYEDALAAINEAIKQGGPERDHFLKQREKFRRALRGRV
ncbi:MAG: M48 family metalloprotease [Syntrophobacteraceae bacterium]